MVARCRLKKSVLLFNPWIYDFAAYDFWFKPLGLLSIGAILKKLGYHVDLVDCLDRFHPLLHKAALAPAVDNHGDYSGKFIRQPIAKPAVLEHVPRKYCRYGMPPEQVMTLLDQIDPPHVVLITSFMTYWYPAVVDAVEIIRNRFPHAIIILGGIYATLATEHAKKTARPDFIIPGEGEIAAVRLIAGLLDGPGGGFTFSSLDELPFPALELYPNLHSAAILTSRGCPFSCSFCASKLLAPHYRRRSPGNVLQEIEQWHEQFNVRQFAFFDDALLLHADKFLKPILASVCDRKWRLNFHTPNGLTPRYIDQELARLFFHAGIRTVRLSFETINAARQQSMSAKVTGAELEQAIELFQKAGYRRSDIGVYVMMGLPGQEVAEVVESIEFVYRLGAKISLASFSPIPGTIEWKNALADGLWSEQDDLLLTNTTVFPLWSKTVGYKAAFDLMHYAKELNQQVAAAPMGEMPVYEHSEQNARVEFE